MHERMTDKSAQPSGEDMIAVIGQPISGTWIELRSFLEQAYEI